MEDNNVNGERTRWNSRDIPTKLILDFVRSANKQGGFKVGKS